MATFNFNCGFYLLLNDGTRIRFEKGAQTVPDDLANHPYLAANGERVDAEPSAPSEPVEAPAPSQPEPIAEPSPVETTAEPAPAEPESVTIEPDGSTHVDTPEEVTEKTALKAEAEALGIAVDGRWGVARLQAEIAAKKSAG